MTFKVSDGFELQAFTKQWSNDAFDYVLDWYDMAWGEYSFVLSEARKFEHWKIIRELDGVVIAQSVIQPEPENEPVAEPTIATYGELVTARDFLVAGETDKAIALIDFPQDKVWGASKGIRGAAQAQSNIVYYARNGFADVALSQLDELIADTMSPVQRMVSAFGGIKSVASFWTQQPKAELTLLAFDTPTARMARNPLALTQREQIRRIA